MSQKDLQNPLKNIIFAGVDDGYAETNIFLSNGNYIRIPSQAKSGELNKISINGSANTVYSYKTSEGSFVVGDIREADTTSFDDYPLSGMNRVIVAHALRKAGIGKDTRLVICSGLPIKKYYLNGKINQELVKAKRKNLLMNDVVSSDGAVLPVVMKHDVIAEGIAAWFDIVIQRNSQGRLVKNDELVSSRIAIIDIGGRTTDIAVIQSGVLDEDRSSTIEVGMLSVRENVAQKIHNKFEIEPSAEQMNSVMNTGKIKLWGKFHELFNEIEEAKKIVVSRIESEVKKRLGNASDLDKIVFVGGTVVQIEKYLEGWFKQQEIGTDPSFANSRGMEKYAEMQMMKS